MSQLNTVMAIFAVVAAAAIIGTVGVFLTTAQSADAWHSLFASKKECTNFMKTVLGNTTAKPKSCVKRWFRTSKKTPITTT
jgi:hypothetical protein